jgi:hypothetical protein
LGFLVNVPLWFGLVLTLNQVAVYRSVSAERKAFQQKVDAMLEEPTRVTPYQYESISPNVDEIFTGLEFSVQDE